MGQINRTIAWEIYPSVMRLEADAIQFLNHKSTTLAEIQQVTNNFKNKHPEILHLFEEDLWKIVSNIRNN